MMLGVGGRDSCTGSSALPGTGLHSLPDSIPDSIPGGQRNTL